MSDIDDKPAPGPDGRIQQARDFMNRVMDNDSVNRERAKYWRRFRWGEQWPAEIQNSRMLESRPCITVNKTDTFCRQVENQQRQQRPRIKVEPTNGEATVKVAKTIKGLVRNIESNRGGGDLAYDTGFSSAVTEGVGFWRVMADYIRDDSFEQELFLAAVEDPSTVYYDDHSSMPDGSDAEEVLIVMDLAKGAFKSMYPGADDGSSFLAADQSLGTTGWVTKDTVRVAEYFTIKRTSMKIHKFRDGSVVWADQMKLIPPGRHNEIVGTRQSIRKTVQWCKLTAMEILEERDLPGRWIPVIPCYGEQAIIEGRRRRAGLIKNAEGPAMMSNFWKTAMTESVALAPKAKWILAEGQDEGYELDWASANTSPKQYLRYKGTDIGGKAAPPPQRLQPEPPPEGAMAMAQSVDADLTAVLGIVDPAMRIGGNVSGKALNAERMQSDNSTFNYYDNMTRSIAFTGRILLDLIPYYYNEPGRIVRIVGDDGQSTTDALNQPHPDDATRILNDVTVGEYDVIMDTGPGFNTKRQEAVDAMMPLFEKNEDLMNKAGDVMFRNMDFPGADTIADRLAASNPLSQIDEKSEIPPGVQMQMKQAQMQIQHLTQELQSAQLLLKNRADVEAQKQAAETHRTLLKESAQTDRNDSDNREWQRDIHTKSFTALGVAEINQAGKIITQHKDHMHDAEQFEKVAEHEDSQLEKASKE